MISMKARRKVSRTADKQGGHTYHAPASISSKGVRKVSYQLPSLLRYLQKQDKMMVPHWSYKD
jgi:hypothetical protein